MLRGVIDEAGRTVLRGWAFDERRPTQPVSLLVTLDGVLLGRVIANRFRQDLREAGIGGGRHGFELRFETELSPLLPHLLRVTCEEDGTDLGRSPWVVEPAATLDDDVLARLQTLLLDGTAQDPALLERRIGFAAAQLDALLQQRADTTLTDAPLALVIDEVMPDSGRDAGSSVLLSHMRALRRLGYRVLFAAADPVPQPVLAEALRKEGIETCGAPLFGSVEEVLRRYGDTLALLYLHRGSIGSRYARLVRHHCRQARILLSIADLQHLRLARQAQVEHRKELLASVRQARAIEFDAMVQADAVLTHSTAEAAAIEKALPGKPVRRALWRATTSPISTPFPARYGVAFLADYAHAPNLDAARRLLRDIMPLVWEHDPTLPLLLAGSRLPHGLDGGDPRVRWIGHVPVLQGLFERVRATVAPLAYGAGIKGKVLESLAAGVPCVMSPIAAEGLELTPALDACVAPDTHGIARLILRLHHDASENARIADAGVAWAGANLSEAAVDAAVRAALAAALSPLPEIQAARPAAQPLDQAHWKL